MSVELTYVCINIKQVVEAAVAHKQHKVHRPTLDAL